MGNIIDQLPITPMGCMGNERGRVYRAYGILKPFMTELSLPLILLAWLSHFKKKKGIEGNKKEKTDQTRRNKARKN